MSIPLILGIIAILIALTLFALLLAGRWETPEQIARQLRGLAGRTDDPSVAFRAWVASDLDGHGELQHWLLGLPDDGFKALTQRVVAFCTDLNIRLSWLVERHLDVAPELRRSVRAIVLNYLEVCREAIGHQAEIGIFRSYYDAVARPADARHQNLRRILFTRLTAAGLTEPLPSYELIMASELQRQALAAKAIREAAGKDWPAFAAILREALEPAASSGDEPPEDRASSQRTSKP